MHAKHAGTIMVESEKKSKSIACNTLLPPDLRCFKKKDPHSEERGLVTTLRGGCRQAVARSDCRRRREARPSMPRPASIMA